VTVNTFILISKKEIKPRHAFLILLFIYALQQFMLNYAAEKVLQKQREGLSLIKYTTEINHLGLIIVGKFL
jgi:hypothetical protein